MIDTSMRDAAADLIASATDGRLAALCTAQGVDLTVLFGSAVRSDPLFPPSDLDVAVLPTLVIAFDRIACHTALVDMLHTDRIDLLDLSTAGVLVRARALGDGIPLYERVAGTYAREQFRSVPLAMELGWLTDLELELLSGR